MDDYKWLWMDMGQSYVKFKHKDTLLKLLLKNLKLEHSIIGHLEFSWFTKYKFDIMVH